MDRSNDNVPGLEETTKMLSWIKPYIRQCGDTPRGRWVLGPRKLLDYLLVYIEKGEGVFTIDGQVCKAVPGSLFWIPPKVLHIMEGLGDYMVCPFIHFDLMYRYPESHWEFTIPSGTHDLSPYKELCHPELPESPFSDLCGAYRFGNIKRIETLMRRVCREAVVAHPGHTLYLSGVMMEILTEILRGLHYDIPEDDHFALSLDVSAEFMRTHICESLMIKDLADSASMSEAWYRRKFQLRFGKSPAAYIRQQRIASAKDLMAFTDYTLSDISKMCGFSTVHSLSKAFSRLEGVSPSVYRKFGKSLVFSTSRVKSYPG